MISTMRKRRAQLWARRHVLALSAFDNLVTAVAVALLGFVLGLLIGVALTVFIFEVEHYRRHLVKLEIEQAEAVAARVVHRLFDGQPERPMGSVDPEQAKRVNNDWTARC